MGNRLAPAARARGGRSSERPDSHARLLPTGATRRRGKEGERSWLTGGAVCIVEDLKRRYAYTVALPTSLIRIE